MKAIFATHGGDTNINNAYDKATREKLAAELEFLPPFYELSSLEARAAEFSQVELIFTTWGMHALTEEQIKRVFPALRAVFYAAGSVQYFARPFLECGVKVTSAFYANGIPVAEYTIAQIILAGKGFYQSSRLYKAGDRKAAHAHSSSLPGNYGYKVGIIGAGVIGTMVIERLKKDYSLEVLVFDPFMPDEKAAKLGVKKTSLEEIFSECTVISNHLANNEQTKGMLNYRLFKSMKPNAAFINTGRGAQVVESDLVKALTEEPARTAVLDVTDPEPVKEGHPFFLLDNVILTPHIAGSMGAEIARMGEFMYDEYKTYANGGKMRFEVTKDMLATMA